MEKNFCENVRKLRKINRLSKSEMAKLLRIGVKSLSKIESGVIPKRLKCEVLVRIKSVFGISYTDIFLEMPEPDLRKKNGNRDLRLLMQ